MTILVSVVIPAYNEEKIIGKCLESLKNQDFPKNKYEIIVVDNNSTDKTAEIAKKYGVKVVKENKRGIAFARQKGLISSKGKIVCQTDADTILPKYWLKRVYAIFKTDRKIVGVGGGYEFFDTKSFIFKIICRFVSISLRVINIFSPVFLGFNHSYKRDVFIELGGYDPRYQVFEDLKAAIELKKMGRIYFDLKLNVYTSVRRLKNEPLGYFLKPIIVFFKTVIMKKYIDIEWKEYR